MEISQRDYDNLIKFDFFINKNMENFSDNVLFAMETFFDFPLTVYTLFNRDSYGKQYVEKIFSRNISEDGLIQYQRKTFESDLFVQQVERSRQGNLHKNLVKISDLDGSELFYQSEYGKYLLNINTPYQVVLRSTGAKLYPSHIVCVFKTKEQGDFNERELILLSKISESFDRAVMLYEQRHKYLLYKSFAEEIADTFNYNLVILDEKETIIFQSEGFKKNLENCFGVQSSYTYILELRKKLYEEKNMEFHQLISKECFYIDDYEISIWPYFCDTGAYREKFYFISMNNKSLKDNISKSIERVSDKSRLMIKYGFTTREFEVASYLKEGMNNKDIAELLCIDYSTVKFHIRNIYQKLEVNHRNAAIIKLLQQ